MAEGELENQNTQKIQGNQNAQGNPGNQNADSGAKVWAAAGENVRRNLEAALFMSSRSMGLPELAKIVGVSAPGFVESELRALQKEYDERGSAVEIANEDGGYYMRVRSEYASKASVLAKGPDISRGGLKVLAFVSKNDGIEQSKLVKSLGSTVYEYVHELLEKGFITRAKKGRTMALRTTPKFKEYFA
ncbi:MAG: SMC-Scp complex subunit ScpB [Candidatus Burarchaeum sp.]|nr:SMC-Scp complex subunit ScpB [Candidatus Burarchaeum sp.]MDO8339771.1 SMC-Scp complex subunit ScpB [Candidatus Burarchaeum sp.]